MTEITAPESPTSADSVTRHGQMPCAVRDHARVLDDTVRLGLLVTALSVVACILVGLIVLCAMRPALPLYVLGG